MPNWTLQLVMLVRLVPPVRIGVVALCAHGLALHPAYQQDGTRVPHAWMVSLSTSGHGMLPHGVSARTAWDYLTALLATDVNWYQSPYALRALLAAGHPVSAIVRRYNPRWRDVIAA